MSFGMYPTLTRQSAGGGDLTPYPINSWVGAVAAWPSANSGIFCKFRVNTPRTVNGIRVLNGAPSGNAKSALYSSDGTTLTQRALSASTALTGSSVLQDILFASPFVCVPFQDYFAFIAVDNGTATFFRVSFSAAAFVTALGLTYTIATAFTTPPTPQLLSGLSAPAGGYSPVLLLV